MKRVIVILLMFLLIVSVGYAEETLDYVPGEVIVKFKEEPEISVDEEIVTTSIDSVDELNDKFQVEEMEDVLKEDSKLQKLKIPEDEDIMSVIEEYENDPNVEYAELNYIRKIFLEPDDTSYSSQWGLPKINASLAWNITKGNGTVIIAVIDTGVDWDHPDLASRIWENSDEVENGADTDGNGYIDDVRGYDFVDQSSGCWLGEDCDGSEDADPMDFHGHGTHVSGIAAADTNNGEGIAGVCWNCTIMPLKAGFKDSNGYGALTDADISQALHYAADNGANVISMSFGGPDTSTLQEAIDYAYNKGVILVAAAGNSNTDDITNAYPAAYNNVISVAATDNNDAKGSSSNSNWGAWIDVAAPGDSIYSTLYDDTYVSWSGTSMAAPHVSGAIGLLLSYDSTLSQADALGALKNNGNNLTDFGAAGLTMPRINIFSALLSLDTAAPDINFVYPTPTNNTYTKSTSFFINITSNEILDTAILEWNNGTKTNQTMNGSGLNWYINKTNLVNLSYSYMVFGDDPAGNSGISEVRQIIVNTTNRIPQVVDIAVSSTDSLNRTNGTLVGIFGFSDTDGDNQVLNETKWFNSSVEIPELVNLTSISYTNTTKNQNWTFSARVYDGVEWSDWDNATIKIKNAIPELAAIADITVNETDWVNLSVSAIDIDYDVVNYAINDSRFDQLGNKFTWLTNTSHSGEYHVSITANDSSDTGSQVVFVTVLDVLDFDNDGIPDFDDTDDDNDGIDDSSDYLTGNVTNIDSTVAVRLRINGSEDVTRIFNGTLKINVTDENNNSLIEFDWNFTESVLAVNWTFDYVPANGTWIIGSLEVSKTVYMNKSVSNHNYVCVTDEVIDSIGSMTSDCTGASETKVACPGDTGQYSCIDLGSRFKVSGLEHSAVKGIYVSPPSDESGGGGTSSSGGGGGGGGSTISRNPNEATKFYAFLSETTYPLMAISSPNIAVNRLSLNVNKKLYKVRINIRVLNKSSTPVKISGKVYQHLNLSTENLEDSDLSEFIEIKFKVKKEWLESKGVDKDEISLYRYKEEWNKLDTEIEREDNSTVYYVSKTPGFSVFAIAATELAEEVIKEVKEEKIEEEVVEEELPAITEIEGGEVEEEPDGFFAIAGRVVGAVYQERPITMSLLTIFILAGVGLFVYFKKLKH